MARHEFQPGRLIAGLFLTLTAVVYAGDAGDAWDTPWFVVIPLVTVGLCLAAAAGTLSHAIRRHRRRALLTRETQDSRADEQIPGR
ncbi:hypothetical protein [Streptomyces phaeochromogenes]|uniref:hypothetical protein n=1 Tax=Streptomyces phaeochromogenes TaxID=1923 RepID=UPI00386B4FF6|nr:hypothetical protein OG277_30465 [Streptomyces phaeochromogenes]WTA04646.1 hypothetical protein OHB08_21175 [Streptomyces phaeochromogenes]